ncbi:MAG TPA: FAD-dependent oxidoreductase [Gemmatimonadales bacterium]|jgi:cholesterol oxidase|nr:FAD-dependent oxidoreductase [Gemmatimonadales bacterium]
MANQFDVIIIGSGFGGAVTACRLAERGFKRILVLERGREWNPDNYPWKSGHWTYNPDCPEHESGWLDLRILDDMVVAQGAGVGGGSLIYANVSIEAKPDLFNRGWPPEITYQELAPYYRAAGAMLKVAELPDNQLTERFKLMREAAQKIGAGERFRKLSLAVTFSDTWNYGLEDRFDERHSVTWANEHGKTQGTCVHRGYCDIGCPVQAKNTLDLNYLARAARLGAEIRALHLARAIEPIEQGYRVRFDVIDPDRHTRTPGMHTADRVILAAGSLGSTELLLRCRDQYRTLPRLSPFLGKNWSSNGDFLTPAFYSKREPPVSPSHGPTITAGIDFLDGPPGAAFLIEDGGIPDLLKAYLDGRLNGRGGSLQARTFLHGLREAALERDALARMMPWFAQGVDAADGRLYLGRKWYAPWRRALKLNWDVDRSATMIQAIVAMHLRLSQATGGHPWVPPTWTVLKNLVTPHPLGGCNVGITQSDGVVDHRGAVFGYPGLYVADGAIIPEAVGLNPSRTIAALAERIAALMS